MAQLELTRSDAESGALPAVCIRCGAAANTVLYRIFKRYPWQTSALALLRIRYEPARCRMRVGTPLCAAHRNYWMWSYVLCILPFVLILPVFFVELITLAVIFRNEFEEPLLVASGVDVLLWLAWLAWLRRRLIWAVRIDEFSIVFDNVSEEVVRRWGASAADVEKRNEGY